MKTRMQPDGLRTSSPPTMQSIMPKPKDPQLVRLGQAISAARRAYGASQEKLAELAGLNVGHLGQIERGETNTTALVLLRIGATLDVPPSEFLAAAARPEHERARMIAEIAATISPLPLAEISLVQALVVQMRSFLTSERLTLQPGSMSEG